MAKDKDIKLEKSELALNLNSFHTPIVEDYFDEKGKNYISVVYEMATHGDLNYTCEKTGIDYKELLQLLEKPNFQRDVAREKKIIDAEGGSAITTKSKIYSHIMIDELKEIGIDKTQKTSDRLRAIEMMLTMSGAINKNEEVKTATAPGVTINFKSSRGNEKDITYIIDNEK